MVQHFSLPSVHKGNDPDIVYSGFAIYGRCSFSMYSYNFLHLVFIELPFFNKVMNEGTQGTC